MARPSIKEQRLEQILQATQRCVARYGIEGSTLERIAEEAGLKRSLVRHFAGNRDILISQLADRVIADSNQQWQAFIAALPSSNNSQYLLDALFGEQQSDPEYTLVLESLIFAAGRDPELREKMQHWLNQFNHALHQLLERDHPHASQVHLATVTFGIVSLYFNLDSLSPLGMSDQFRPSARDAAEQLLALLAA